MLIEMSPAQRQALMPHAATLEKFGLELEEFGGDSVRLSAVPAVLDPSECEAAVRALAEDLEGLDRGSGVEDALRKIAATMACHAAVKANYPLTMEKMRYILEELRRTAYSSVCPHGRPVVLRITRREIEKNFQRISRRVRDLVAGRAAGSGAGRALCVSSIVRLETACVRLLLDSRPLRSR